MAAEASTAPSEVEHFNPAKSDSETKTSGHDSRFGDHLFRFLPCQLSIVMNMDTEMPQELLEESSVIERSDGETVTNVKELLLEAWRNRWSEIEFGINVKKVLPRGISGDVYDLADVILQQSLIGPSPNTVLLSYLVHSINGRIVSYGAVIEAVSSTSDLNRQECVNCLLDLIRSLLPKTNCSGGEEECIRLARSIVKLSSWLLQVLKHFSLQMVEARNQLPSQVQYPGQNLSTLFLSTTSNQKTLKIIEKTSEMIAYISKSSFLTCLLNVGKGEDPNGHKRLMQSFKELKVVDLKHSLLSSSFGGLASTSTESLDSVSKFLETVDWSESKAAQLACKQMETGPESKLLSLRTSPSYGYVTLNSIIAFNAVLNPVSDINLVARQIFTLSQLYSIRMPDLYCEIIRSCFMGLVDAGEKSASTVPSSGEELRWAAFTFLKTPQILSKVHKMSKSVETEDCSDGDTLEDIDGGLEKLVNLTPLLDLTDCKSNCDCLQLFLSELCKTELISESKMVRLVEGRKKETVKSSALGRTDSSQTNQAGPSLILRAEPTVTSILRTLDADYSKNQEGLLGVLCHMVTGKSFELILNAAAATGKLESFTTKLLLFNEFNKQMDGESGKASQTRALLFDVTFLMLCHITQNYGVEIITKNRSPGHQIQDSFFATWCGQCLPKSGQYCCPDLILGSCDPTRVDNLLNQFTSDEVESCFKTSLVKWHEVCHNLPGSMKEVLVAWEEDAITVEEVTKIVDNVKSRMCCLPIVISAWLCSYINTLHHEERELPLDLLKQFMTPLPLDHPAVETKPSGDTQEVQPLFYKERSTLMSAIIKKMMFDLQPQVEVTKPKPGVSPICHGLTVKTSFDQILQADFTIAHTRSWLDMKCVNDMSTLLNVGGSDWFVDALVRQFLQFDCENELQKAVGLMFGLFHLDLEKCAISLVDKILPAYLLASARQDILFEPRASSLARLALVTIFAAFALKDGNERSGEKNGSLKGKDEEMDVDSSMVIKPDPDSVPSVLGIKPSLLPAFESCPYYIRRQLTSSPKSSLDLMEDPLTKSVANLVLLLHSILNDPEINQRTLFPGIFLEQLILVGKEESRKLVQFLPIDTTLSLIRMSPESITFEYLMALSDLSTSKSRKCTARTLCQLLRGKRLSRSLS